MSSIYVGESNLTRYFQLFPPLVNECFIKMKFENLADMNIPKAAQRIFIMNLGKKLYTVH